MDAYVRAGRGAVATAGRWRGDGQASSGTRIRLAFPTKRTPRGPEDSSPWGLDHHHEDLAFYPAGYYNPGFYSPLSTKPSCLVRITRDAGQNATGLIIDEFNWYFPRTEIGRLRVNTEFIRS